jgi:hypothetical protein
MVWNTFLGAGHMRLVRNELLSSQKMLEAKKNFIELPDADVPKNNGVINETPKNMYHFSSCFLLCL